MKNAIQYFNLGKNMMTISQNTYPAFIANHVQLIPLSKNLQIYLKGQNRIYNIPEYKIWNKFFKLLKNEKDL